jgi:hypothetical protein
VDISSGSMESIRIRGIDIIPSTFELVKWNRNLVIDIWILSINVISGESISWFSDSFLFNIVNSKSSVS